MDHIMSIDGSETKSTPDERLEDLKARNLPTPDNQQSIGDGGLSKLMDRDLYQATKEGDVENFMSALEEVSKSRKLALPLIFDQVTPSKNSLLHMAASSGSDHLMKLILTHYPDLVTKSNSSEDTSLHVAIRDGRFNATEMLIRKDKEIMYWKNKASKSPLYLAVEKCMSSEWRNHEGAGKKILQLLLEETARDEAYADKIQGMSPVLAALQMRSNDALTEVVDRLPKLLHVRGEDGGTPLHSAASLGNAEAVKFLLDKCPDLALQTDKNGSYPIHIACQERRGYVTIKQLLSHTWPDLTEIKNNKGQNILHAAAKAGDHNAFFAISAAARKSVKKLANSKDADGNTPLHLASMHNHCEVLHSLTKVSDVTLQNNDGLTALDVAMESGSLSTKNPASQLRGRAILIVAGAQRSEGRDVLSPREQHSGASTSPRAEGIKDQVNTLLLVATLVASVTFTAGLTLPGGYNASGDPHPGTATALHHGVFQLFVISNTFAMYSSILAVVVLLWGLSRDFLVAELAYQSAGPLLLMALTGMMVAFFAAVTVAVSKLTWLGSLVLSFGVLYLAMVVAVLSALVFPFSKSVMWIVCLYYLPVAQWASDVDPEFVKLYLGVFKMRFRSIGRKCCRMCRRC